MADQRGLGARLAMKVLVFFSPGQSPNWVYARPGENENAVLNPTLFPGMGDTSLIVEVDDPDLFEASDAENAVAAFLAQT